MQELHTYYTRQGIANYAVRIGHIFCILSTLQVTLRVSREICSFLFQRNSQKLHEDFEMFKLMNLFKEYLDKNLSD